MSSTGSTSIDTGIHLFAGGMGGTAGAIITCPLEVVKTRLQSSNSGFGSSQRPPGPTPHPNGAPGGDAAATRSGTRFQQWRRIHHRQLRSALDGRGGRILVASQSPSAGPMLSGLRMASSSPSLYGQGAGGGGGQPVTNVVQCLRFIMETEGVRGLFRGLGPNLVGVAPSRAIYFFTYSTVKRKANSSVPVSNRDTPFVHVVSAACAGFSASTCTNPIWLVKTRLQLDRATGSKELTVRQCVRNIFKSHGVRGFWKGVTASYWGISETIIHFVIYESLKKQVIERQALKRRRREAKGGASAEGERNLMDFAGFMACGACSKTCATIVAYPHEVARTRLREEGTKYRSFWPTLATVAREEGRRGLYRGLLTQLIRQIPNTAVMMATYELTVYLMTRYLKGGDDDNGSRSSQGQ